MCGFTGYFDKKSRHEEYIIHSMNNVLRNRGPDSSDYFIDKNIGISLGHRRLAIQDLSENGKQPMKSANNRFIIVFNGEIYNHLDLRKEINKKIGNKIWNGNSDTETLLTAIEVYGIEETLKLINGMFAFAILDSYNKILYLCRDRYGEKPLYYGFNNGVLFFGSQPSSFKPHPKWLPELSSFGLNEYLVKGFVGGQYSIYKNIYKLKPANYIAINLDNINLLNCKQYWHHKKEIFEINDPDIFIKQLGDKLEKIVKKRTISDRKIGSFLSGGIDSSLITYYLQKQFNNPIDTFTIGFKDLNYDESESAKRISSFLGTNHNEAVFTTDNLINSITNLPRIWDEPFSDPSQLPTLLLSEIATKKIKVAFSGDGGDELFCGYTRYNKGYDLYQLIKNSPSFFNTFYKYFSLVLSSNYSLSLMKFLPDNIRPNSIIDRTQKFTKLLNLHKEKDYYSEINKIFSQDNDLMANKNLEITNEFPFSEEFNNYREYMIERDILDYLPNDILTKVDRSSMFNGLEVRVPFLDSEFSTWARNIPINYKRLDGDGKWPLRKLLSLKIPKHLFNKPKKGFGIPLFELINNSLKSIIYEKLSTSKIKNQGIFNNFYIQEILNDHYSGKIRYHNQIWNLLIFQLWYDDNF